MARPSRWMQFTKNFNAMSDTFDDAFKNYEVNKIKKQDYFEDEDQTVKLKGDALRSAQFADIANVYEKYGDMEGAMKLRTSDATLQGLMSDNRVKLGTEDARMAAPGIQNTLNTQNARLAGLQADSAQTTVDQNEAVASIFKEAGAMNFNSAADEQAFLTNRLKELPPSIAGPALKAFSEFGSDAIAIESNRILANASRALRSGNINDFVNFYNKDIADGFKLSITGNNVDGYQAIATDADGKSEQIGQAGTEAELLNLFAGRIKDPMSVLGGAVDNLAYRQSQQNLKKTEKDIDKIDSDILVDKAQISQITAKIKQIDSNIEVNDAQILNLNKELDVKDANISRVLAETVFVKGVKSDQIRKEIQNINSQISSRGLGDSLTVQQRTLVAAQAAETRAKTARLDPARPETAEERKRFVRASVEEMLQKVLLYDQNTSQEDLNQIRDVYLNTMGSGDFSIEEITEQ